MDHWPTGKLCEADLWVYLTYHTAQLYAGLKENIDFPNFWQYRKCLLADCLTFWRAIARKCASIFPGFCHEGGPDRCWKNAATSVLAKKLSCRAVTSASAFFVAFGKTNRHIDRNNFQIWTIIEQLRKR